MAGSRTFTGVFRVDEGWREPGQPDGTVAIYVTRPLKPNGELLLACLREHPATRDTEDKKFEYGVDEERTDGGLPMFFVPEEWLSADRKSITVPEARHGNKPMR